MTWECEECKSTLLRCSGCGCPLDGHYKARLPARPWQVVGQDPEPDDNRWVETTVKLEEEDQPEDFEIYQDWYNNDHWQNCEGEVLAWCELPTPWQKAT